jgi:hypothetical protein
LERNHEGGKEMTTPFYEKARNLFLKTQDAQIQKGLQKYPEPFNPMSWTPQELLNHALEETVDSVHYLVGLKVQLDAKDNYIKQLEQELRYLKSENTRLQTVVNVAKIKEKNGQLHKYFDPDDQ